LVVTVGSLVAFAKPSFAEAAWTSPVTLSAVGQDASAPQVGVDAHGNAVVTWARFDGAYERIQARTRSTTGALGPIVGLSGHGPQDAFAPQVAVNPAGDAVFTWRHFDGANWRIQTRVLSATGGLSPVQTLSGAGQDAFGPEVGIDRAGDAVFTWQRSDGTYRRIQARFRSDAGILGPVQTLSAKGRNAQRPQIAVNRHGEAVFTWEGFIPGSSGCCTRIQARTRSSAGVLSPIRIVSPPHDSSQGVTTPQVGVDAQGNAVLTWRFIQFDFRDESSIQARTLPSAGGLGPVRTLSPEGFTGRFAGGPQVAINGAGDSIFTWHFATDYADETLQVQARVRPAAGPFGPVLHFSPDSDDAFDPQVGLDDTGDAALTWAQADFGQHTIKARIRPAAGPLGPIRTLSTVGQDASEPQIAVNEPGDAVVTWQVRRAGHTVIQGAAGTTLTKQTQNSLGSATDVTRRDTAP
jgi:hypothetical protein